MNKTVYLRDEEVPIWEKARELSGDKLSPVIVAALKRFVTEKEAAAKGYERIKISFRDSTDHFIPKTKAFFGKWIIGPEEPLRDDDWSTDLVCAVAETAKGNVVVYRRVEALNGLQEEFRVYRSFEEAAKNPDVGYAARAALEKRGTPVEELDI